LQVHQIELEMQNEDMRRIQVELPLSGRAVLSSTIWVVHVAIGQQEQFLKANLRALTSGAWSGDSTNRSSNSYAMLTKTFASYTANLLKPMRPSPN